jgi:hypothetical protein
MVHFRTSSSVCSSSDQEQRYGKNDHKPGARASWDFSPASGALVRFPGGGCPIFEPAGQARRFCLRRAATPAASSTSAPRAGDFLLRDAGHFLPDHARCICHGRPPRSVRICRVAWRERSACADGGISFARWQRLFLKENAVFDWRRLAGCGHGPGVQERSLTRPAGASPDR